MIWFTSDTHFNHANIIKYAARPFSSVQEMNEKLIENWNAVVSTDDLVYMLGDFIWAIKGTDKREEFFRIRNQLNGQIHFLRGNHDPDWHKFVWADEFDVDNKYKPKVGDKFSGPYLEIQISTQHITLCHYAMRVFNNSHRGAWNLFGHSHATLLDDPHSLSIDVGVDAQNYRPISFDEVKQIMSKKLWRPLDHHGEKQEGGGVGLSKAEYQKEERRRLYLQLHDEFGTLIST